MINLYFRSRASEFSSQPDCYLVCVLDKWVIFVCLTYQIEKCESFVTLRLVLYNVSPTTVWAIPTQESSPCITDGKPPVTEHAKITLYYVICWTRWPWRLYGKMSGYPQSVKKHWVNDWWISKSTSDLYCLVNKSFDTCGKWTKRKLRYSRKQGESDKSLGKKLFFNEFNRW